MVGFFMAQSAEEVKRLFKNLMKIFIENMSFSELGSIVNLVMKLSGMKIRSRNVNVKTVSIIIDKFILKCLKLHF